MSDSAFSPETWRLAIFIGVFVAMASWEFIAPARALVASKGQRWVTNLALTMVNVGLIRLVMPAAAVGAATWAERNGFGLLPMIGLPPLLAGIVGFILLDLIIWAQHVLLHKVPVLWRFHAVHHADRDLDVTSGLRFHPVEAVLSMALKMAAAAALGVPPFAVFLFEVVLNAFAQFDHANISLPDWLDRPLRRVVVTPDMHRTHHSIDPRETDSNYGFFLSIWDRLFNVYTDEPAVGRQRLVIGLAEYQSEAPARLGWSLVLPFRARPRTDRAETSAERDQHRHRSPKA